MPRFCHQFSLPTFGHTYADPKTAAAAFVAFPSLFASPMLNHHPLWFLLAFPGLHGHPAPLSAAAGCPSAVGPLDSAFPASIVRSHQNAQFPEADRRSVPQGHQGRQNFRRRHVRNRQIMWQRKMCIYVCRSMSLVGIFKYFLSMIYGHVSKFGTSDVTGGI